MKSLKRSKRIYSLERTIQLYPLTREDPLSPQKSLLRGLLTDVSRFLPEVEGLGRDLVTLEARVEHEGVSMLATSLCTLGKALDKGLSEGTFVCPQGFKRLKGQKIPLLYGGIFNKVFDSVTGELRRGGDCTLEISLLRQLLFFLAEILFASQERVFTLQRS